MDDRAVMTPRLTIDLDKKCAECGKGGAAESGICIRCVYSAAFKPMKSAQGRAVQRRLREILLKAKPQ